MERVEVNLDGVKSIVDFEVIEIIDGIYPYLALFGINWEFDNSAVLVWRIEICPLSQTQWGW